MTQRAGRLSVGRYFREQVLSFIFMFILLLLMLCVAFCRFLKCLCVILHDYLRGLPRGLMMRASHKAGYVDVTKER